MKYTVNKNCVGCGACAVICPAVFRMGEYGRAVAMSNDVPDDALEDAEDAMGGCPVGAVQRETV